MFFKIVVKIFENFTGKHLCRSLFLINFIPNRLQFKFFLVKFAKFLGTSFNRTLPPAASVFSKDFFDISYENSHTRTAEDSKYLQLIYFLNTNPFWFAERIFLIDGILTLANYLHSVKEFTLRFLYRLNQPLWEITALHKLISIVLQLTNQIG